MDFGLNASDNSDIALRVVCVVCYAMLSR